jgi:hypothetical protein
MAISGIDALFVGPGFHNSQTLTSRMRNWGFRCHFANSMRTARELVHSTRVDLVLSQVGLPDGTGFGLLASLSGLPITAYLCFPVENSCYWLPAMDSGTNCLGSPALRSSEFVNALEKMTHRLPLNPKINCESTGPRDAASSAADLR